MVRGLVQCLGMAVFLVTIPVVGPILDALAMSGIDSAAQRHAGTGPVVVVEKPEGKQASAAPVDLSDEEAQRLYETLSTRAVNTFAVDMYSKLDRGDKNLAFSPLSFFTPLAVMYEGAQGKSREELVRVLGLDGLVMSLRGTFPGLLEALKDSVLEEDGRLSIANALWVNTSSDYEMCEQFKEVADKIYKTALHEADFERSGDAAIEKINQWIANMTAQRITRLASRKNVLPTPSTEPFCLLLNVISFKCKWAQVFDLTATRDEQFTLLDGSRIEVPMMHHFSGTYSYLEESDFRVVELPYIGNQLHAAVFLPTTIGGLADFEKSVTSDNLSSWLSRLSEWPKGVDVSLPRFTLSYRLV